VLGSFVVLLIAVPLLLAFILVPIPVCRPIVPLSPLVIPVPLSFPSLFIVLLFCCVSLSSSSPCHSCLFVVPVSVYRPLIPLSSLVISVLLSFPLFPSILVLVVILLSHCCPCSYPVSSISTCFPLCKQWLTMAGAGFIAHSCCPYSHCCLSSIIVPLSFSLAPHCPCCFLILRLLGCPLAPAFSPASSCSQWQGGCWGHHLQLCPCCPSLTSSVYC
jgi:hypothetical protein